MIILVITCRHLLGTNVTDYHCDVLLVVIVIFHTEIFSTMVVFQEALFD
jgi:hypothetical protein